MDLQANRAQDAHGAHVAVGLDAFRRAWLDFKLALAGLHAAEENEAQVAHWVIEGMASFADLREVREQVKAARVARTVARKHYIRLSTLAAAAARGVDRRRDARRAHLCRDPRRPRRAAGRAP